MDNYKKKYLKYKKKYLELKNINFQLGGYWGDTDLKYLFSKVITSLINFKTEHKQLQNLNVEKFEELLKNVNEKSYKDIYILITNILSDFDGTFKSFLNCFLKFYFPESNSESNQKRIKEIDINEDTFKSDDQNNLANTSLALLKYLQNVNINELEETDQFYKKNKEDGAKKEADLQKAVNEINEKSRKEEEEARKHAEAEEARKQEEAEEARKQEKEERLKNLGVPEQTNVNKIINDFEGNK